MRLFSSRSSGLTLCLLLTAVAAISSAQTQQIAITFDDLPTHGSLPANETRLEIAKSILATLRAEHVPLT